MTIGLHLPNREMTDDDWQRIDALGCQDLVDLDLFAHRWPEVKRRWPDVRLHARVYVRGNDLDPAGEARKLAELVGRYGPLVATWRMRNEPNLESVGITPPGWLAYLLAFGAEAKALCPDILLFVPAIAPWWVGWKGWLRVSAEAMDSGCYAGRDAHVYGACEEVANILWEMRGLRNSDRILITELNFAAGRQVDLAVYARELPVIIEECGKWSAEAACWFIWQWERPDMQLPTTVDARGTPMEAAIARINGREVREMVQINDPSLEAMIQQDPGLWQAWVNAGGVRDNYRRFRLGQGREPTTDDAMRFLIGQVRASVMELELAGEKRFPR